MTPRETVTSAGYTIRHNPPNAYKLSNRDNGFLGLFYGSHAGAVDYFYELVFASKPEKKTEEEPPSNEDRPVDPKHARKRCKQRFRFKMSKRQMPGSASRLLRARPAVFAPANGGHEAYGR